MSTSPFHEGEQLLQSRLGVRDKIETIGHQIVRDFMPEQHREFFARLPCVFVGSACGAFPFVADLIDRSPHLDRIDALQRRS